MSSYFTPNIDAQPVAPWSTALLAQRDVAQQIPINFVTTPAVALTAVCFGHGRYEDDIAERCVSDLLAMGFRRLLVDLYWDVSRNTWSLCPVEVPASMSDSTPSPTLRAHSTSSARISSVQLTTPTRAARAKTSTLTLSTATERSPRQILSASSSIAASTGAPRASSSSNSPSSLNWSTLHTPTSSTASIISSPSGPLYELGPYSCTSTMQLSLLATIVAQYLDGSETTLSAFMQYLQINVHVAASLDNPAGTAQTVNDTDMLPGLENALSVVLADSLSSYLYTPSMLFSDRNNLNTSWYGVSEAHYPDSNYFISEEGPDGIYASSDGWPCEAYIELEKFRRLLISFGSIDSQMSDYRLDADAATIFAPGYIQQTPLTSLSATGQIMSGCFFDTNIKALARANNSWAFSSDVIVPNEGASAILIANTSISNLTSCGISPILNQTILNSTADNSTSIPSYASLANAAIWSWAPNEPANDSAFSPYYASVPSPPAATQFRCAAFNALSTPSGRWHVADCTGQHYAACRSTTNPYTWTISTYRGTYTDVDNNCPSGFTFAVPRTALENAHLLGTLRASRPDILSSSKSTDPDGDSSSDPSDGIIWINFNSLSAAGCWVAGVNESCPYALPSGDADRRRQVIVPTVAGVIVLFLGLLTMFVKCAANRQSSRRRRRRKGEGGWDYEGVPS
ncbi:MAG: hypothetical protein M1821_005349 [Bathelium mastoideum]|nr:MAG: hypothetical protein M1821_005349 [Bathelium mastoideum]